MTTLSTATVVIPDDGQEHPCACGRGAFCVWDCDGWRPAVIVDANRVDVDCNGITDECPHCARELVIAASRDKDQQEGTR